MANIRLNNILLEKLIENEVNAALPNIPESEKEILRQELRTRYNLYKSYTKVIPNFWKKYGEYLKTKQWRELRETVFKRDGYKCLLCGEKANNCHHLSYGNMLKYGYSKRLECASLCKKCHEKIHDKALKF
jgi:hypothetical protein